MQICNWCEKEIVVDPALSTLRESLADLDLCAICQPTFTEQQVIDGGCCLTCYEINTGLGQTQREWLYPPYCLKCKSPVYFSCAFNMDSINYQLKKGHLSEADRDLRLSKEYAKFDKQRLKAKHLKKQFNNGTEPESIYYQAFAEERLCMNCLWKEIKKAKQKKVRKSIRYRIEHSEYAQMA